MISQRVFCVSRGLVCLNLDKSLQPVFEADDAAFDEHASLIASADKLLVSTGSGELLLIDPRADKFKLISRQKVFDDETGLLSHPAIVGKRLFIRGSREIVCVDLSVQSE